MSALYIVVFWLWPIWATALGFGAADVVRSRRRGASTITTSLATSLLALAVLSAAAGTAHFEVALDLDRAANCDFTEVCNRDWHNALDETVARPVGALLVACGTMAAVLLVAAGRTRSGWSPRTWRGALAACLTAAAVLVSLFLGTAALRLPHANESRAHGIEERRQMHIALTGLAGLVVGSLAGQAVARASRPAFEPLRPA